MVRRRIEDRTAIVTGAAQGIGRAIVLRLAEAGVRRMLLTDRRDVAETIALLGNVEATAVLADLIEDEAADRIVDAALARFDGIDILINAAGVTDRAGVLEATPEAFQKIFRINTFAPALLMRRTIANMIERRHGGTIVNVLSMNVHGGPPSLALYSASKSALALLTKNAGHAHRFDRIRVNGINVGWVDTPAERVMHESLGRPPEWLPTRSAEQPFGRLLEADDVARLATFLATDASYPMTGALVDQEQWATGMQSGQ